MMPQLSIFLCQDFLFHQETGKEESVTSFLLHSNPPAETVWVGSIWSQIVRFIWNELVQYFLRCL